MDFVDADRLFVPLLSLARLDPFVVTPLEPVEIKHERSGLNPMLAKESEGITFQDDLTKTIPQLELIVGPFHDAWNEDLPDPGFDTFPHRVRPAVPVVEVAHDADPLGVRCPNGKSRTGVSVNFGQMSAQFFVNLEMVTLPIEVHVEVAKNRSVGVWIADLEALAGPGSDLQQIIKSLRYIGELRFEQAFIRDTICRKLALWVVSVNDRQFFRVRPKSPDDPQSIDLMQAEDAKR